MDEYISREAAIDKMRSLKSSFRAKNDWDSGYDTAIAEAFEHIKRVPSADVQPVNQWISVKDRLPENCIEVLVYDTDCGIVIGWYDKEIGDFAADFISPLDAVTHWQPLPEPPKDGDAE